MRLGHDLYFLDDREDLHKNYKQISIYPDYCPICNSGIQAEYFMLYFKDRKAELLCGCPRESCKSLFFVEYIQTAFPSRNREIEFVINKYYPVSIVTEKFEEEIEKLSPQFVEIYSQALHAENEELFLICGVGYRKSIEYLIKDYAIKMSGEEEREQIEALPLQQCITKYIDHPTIKQMAKRAVWIGNDETHFVRKWAEKDLRDLKKLINLTVHYISMEILANKYQDEMQ